jgi:hypothetical protein
MSAPDLHDKINIGMIFLVIVSSNPFNEHENITFAASTANKYQHQEEKNIQNVLNNTDDITSQ